MKVQKLCFLFIFLTFSISVFSEYKGIVSGRIVTADREVVNFATVHLKGSARGSGTNKDGLYHIKARPGNTRWSLRHSDIKPSKRPWR